MRPSQDSRDTLLSLLLKVARCDLVRINEHDAGKINRHEFGQHELSALLDKALEPNQASDFTQACVVEYEACQMSTSLYSNKHIHIEFTPLATSINNGLESDDRKILPQVQSMPSHTEIDLYHHRELPTFLRDFAESGNYPKRNAVSDDQHLLITFLQTLIVTNNGLRMIDQYIHLTRDNLTKLQSRTSLQREIDEQINHSSLALCMIHCIDFQHVNRKFGQAKGDKVLYEITHIINQYTRNDDISGRFGGALFGIAIQATSIDDAHKLALKLQEALNNKHYLQNAIRLGFNVGVAFVSQQEAELDNSSTSSLLINRAEQALKAAQSQASPSIVQWEPDKFSFDEQEFNYLGGIFTPDNVTNYRNMLLLWDISSIIADEHSFSRLIKSVIERLAFTFEFTYAGVITTEQSLDDKDNANEAQARSYAFKLFDNTEIKEVDIDECEDKALLTEAAQTAISNSQHTEHEENGNNALIIPLGTSTKECFFILGEVSALDLTHDSIMLFVGFARQIGKALKRSQLEDELNQKLERQNAQLEQELHELKAGMQSSALVYRSAKMQKIVEQTQRASQTDTTVLVTGESGTGKEKLIHAIHNLSSRSSKPLVIVDCGSIPETLIESELFGHVKGAFTGAQSESKGKIHAADGGILVLDEIGELPISMQPKLLRFVQEKHYTPVGSNKSFGVDVKIVAVTNRDLAFEVTQGRFRKDLFYRLNVVSLHNPPLRERLEDIELLCQHFLSKFYRQFEMDKKFLSERTINMMKAYDWPGNVRELENKLMQASLLTVGDEIKFEDLNLDTQVHLHETQTNERDTKRQISPLENFSHHDVLSSGIDNNAVVDTSEAHRLSNAELEAAQSNSLTGGAQQSNDAMQTSISNNESVPVRTEHSEEQWQISFSDCIAKLIQHLADAKINDLSIGQLVEAHLLHMSYTQCGSHSKTALLLSIPVSTARRKLLKPLPDSAAVVSVDAWRDLTHLMWLLVDKQVVVEQPVETIKRLTADQILKQYANNMNLASHLMGVSEPTMYKIRKSLM
jgi:diguanylate cyclase (GGDEF)-like protein